MKYNIYIYILLMKRSGRLIGGGGVEEVTYLYTVIVWKRKQEVLPGSLHFEVLPLSLIM